MVVFVVVSLTFYAGLAFFRPAAAIAVILAALPSYQIRFTVAGIPSTFLEWLILLLAVVTLMKSFRQFPIHRARLAAVLHNFPLLAVFAGLLILAAAFAALVPPERLRALGIFKAYFLEGATFFLLCLIHLDTRQKTVFAIKALGVLVLGLSLFGVYQFFTLYRLPPAWWGPGIEPRRVVSLYTYPNAVSLLITPILAFFTSLLALGDKVRTILPMRWLATVVVAGLVLLVLTFSRGAWMGYLGAVIFLLLFTSYRKGLLAALGGSIVLLLFLPQAQARILPAVTGTDPAGLERFKLWRGAWEMIKASPVLGGGLMGFRDWYGALRQSNTDEILNYPHNFFLNFWVETGILGLLAVLGLLADAARKAKALYIKNPAARGPVIATLAAWVALLIHGQLDVPFFKNDLAILFWFFLTLIPITELFETQN
ncbi:MAG: O-antigen ligase family protein [Patescibacteria group bacterium]|nr:O-antigen ligase family protein [Patescibacteria group bacterium]